jgi:inner membrane protein
MDTDGYYEAYYSLLDRGGDIDFRHYPSRQALLRGIAHHWPVQRLQWFSKGFYSVGLRGNDIVISDLRMGMEPNYVFTFKVGERANPHARPTPPVQLQVNWDTRKLGWLWQRIWGKHQVTAAQTH